MPVIVKLRGGLGNQLFQIAAADHLARRLNAPLALDLKELLNDPKRIFELEYLRESVGFTLINDGSIRDKLRKAKLRLLGHKLEVEPIFSESGFEYDRRFDDIASPLQLNGYFQSHRYFPNFDHLKRSEFIPPASLDASQLENEIVSSVSVAVHVRRGDYVSEKHTNAFHGVLDEHYYLEAAKFIAARVADPRFFIFSDEPDWVRANFQLPFNFEVVDVARGPSGLTDLRLMAKCTHHIIANSTLSWWAAFLALTPEQIVVAPKRWFAHDRNPDQDLIPLGWNRLG